VLITDKKVIKGIFVKRISRFSALVKIKRETEYVYLPNPGRLRELLVPGARVVHSLHGKANRKTCYDLIMAYSDSTLVCIDSRIPNKLIGEALYRKEIAEITGYSVIKSEVMFGKSRLDFLLLGAQKKTFIEVKSVTLVKDEIAYFPDAITTRGTRHVKELIRAKHEGFEAIILFVIQRPDASAFSPQALTDPAFASSLKRAHAEGVAILPYVSTVTLQAIRLFKKIPFPL
jgi:sugar fermentation stimulation protein A